MNQKEKAAPQATNHRETAPNSQANNNTPPVKQQESPNGSTQWLKDCEICNTGLCTQMRNYIDQGMSARSASRQMEQDCSGLWPADKIHGRYRYYVKGHAGGNVGKPHKFTDDEVLQRAEEIKKQRFREWLVGLSGRELAATYIQSLLGQTDCSGSCPEFSPNPNRDECPARLLHHKILNHCRTPEAVVVMIEDVHPEFQKGAL